MWWCQLSGFVVLVRNLDAPTIRAARAGNDEVWNGAIKACGGLALKTLMDFPTMGTLLCNQIAALTLPIPPTGEKT